MAKVMIIEDIKKALEDHGGEWKENNGVWDFSVLVAERKMFLSKKKLTYKAKVKIDDDSGLVKFSEMLMEIGSGFSSWGFGFKAETYNTLSGAREGTIEEQSNLFGKKYQYKFDYKEVRLKVKNAVEKSGYKFEYQILPV